MKKNSKLTKEKFDNLLEWFSADRDEAGVIYEKNRKGLIRFFRFRGCDESETLADETITRLAKKLPEIKFDSNLKTITYFYSFASKIFLEEITSRKKTESLTGLKENLAGAATAPFFDEPAEPEMECLENCLSKLPPEERGMILDYYSEDKKAKSEKRKRLAEDRNLKVTTLHTRMHRIRISLRKCVEKCLARRNL